MQEAVIVSAVRTPVGTFGGAFKDVPATALGAQAVIAALDRAGITGEAVDEVVLGCVLQAGLGQNPARQAALGAGIPKEVPATTVNMLCGSGLKAVAIAAQMIRAGDAEVVVAGGMENMSRAPYLAPAARFGARLGPSTLIDSMVHDGLTDAFEDIHMGITAENLASQYGITRVAQDEFALASQQKAARAIDERRFSDEIVPIEVPEKRGTRVIDNDEGPRAGTTLDGLAKLRAAFKRDDGTVTAGNASGINDGAAAVVVMSAGRASELGLVPLGTVESHASVGVEPAIMGIGPVPAVRKALESRGPATRRHRRLRAQRGVRRAVAGRDRRARARPRADQPERRGDRARPSDRCQRRPHPRDAAARDEAHACDPRRRGAVRRRRPGAGGHHPQRRRLRPAGYHSSGSLDCRSNQRSAAPSAMAQGRTTGGRAGATRGPGSNAWPISAALDSSKRSAAASAMADRRKAARA